MKKYDDDKILEKQKETAMKWVAFCFLGIPVIFFLLSHLSQILDSDISDEQSRYLKAKGLTSEQFFKEICQLQAICKEYPKARKKCAIAGNPLQCIEINLESKDFTRCSNNGKIEDINENIEPKIIQCLSYR